MAQTEALIDTLKQALKTHRVTYADIAHRLDMSEANIKRLFASKRFSLQRLEQICALIDLQLSDLFELYETSRQRITTLTLAQEKELVSDIKLLLVAVSVRNRLSFEDMLEHYDLSASECIRHLARLDKLKIIDLLPNNRIKLRIDEHFHWLPDGPIERFYEQQIERQFLKSRFNGEMSERLFLYGLLSDASIQILLRKIQAMNREIAELSRQDAHLPLTKRHNIGLMVAMRPWDLEAFIPYLKHRQQQDRQ